MFDNMCFFCYHIYMEQSVILGILFSIQAKKTKATDLADKFEISTRTVYRYIDVLCGAGVPILSQKGKNGGFFIADYYKVREFFLTREEKQYLLDLLDSKTDENAKYLKLKFSAIGTF